jgi:hypothetical protein
MRASDEQYLAEGSVIAVLRLRTEEVCENVIFNDDVA